MGDAGNWIWLLRRDNPKTQIQTHSYLIKQGEKYMATKKPAKKTTRKPNAAFMKPLQPDDALAEVVGDKPLPRTEITKRLWAYIKKNGLQDKKNRRNINADDALRPIFNGKKQVSMFEMTKLVARHVS